MRKGTSFVSLLVLVLLLAGCSGIVPQVEERMPEDEAAACIAPIAFETEEAFLECKAEVKREGIGQEYRDQVVDSISEYYLPSYVPGTMTFRNISISDNFFQVFYEPYPDVAATTSDAGYKYSLAYSCSMVLFSAYRGIPGQASAEDVIAVALDRGLVEIRNPKLKAGFRLFAAMDYVDGKKIADEKAVAEGPQFPWYCEFTDGENYFALCVPWTMSEDDVYKMIDPVKVDAVSRMQELGIE